MTAEEICKHELVPLQFAYKILRRLERAKFVESIRGADGGFILLANLKKQSLFDLIDAMEVDRLVGSCLNEDFECTYRKKNGVCNVHNQLHALQRTINDQFKSITLHQLITGKA